MLLLIGKRCARGNNVDVPRVDKFLRPGREQLGELARGFAALGAAAEVQPRRVHADAADAARFTNWLAFNGLGPGGDVALDLRVERAADREDPAPSTAQGNSLVAPAELSASAHWPAGMANGQLTSP